MKKLLSFVVLLSFLGMINASVAIAYRENWDIPLMETRLECGIKYEVLDSVELYVNHAFAETENGGLSIPDASFLRALDTSSTNPVIVSIITILSCLCRSQNKHTSQVN